MSTVGIHHLWLLHRFLMMLYNSRIHLILWGFWCCCMTAEFIWFMGFLMLLYDSRIHLILWGFWCCCMTAEFIWFYGVSDAAVWHQNSFEFMGFLMLLYDSRIHLILWGFWCCCMTSKFIWVYGVSDAAVWQQNSSDFMDLLTLYVLKFNTLHFRESIGARLQVCFFENKRHYIHN